MYHKAADLRTLLFWPLLGIPLIFLVSLGTVNLSNFFSSTAPPVNDHGSHVEIHVAEDGSRVEIYAKLPDFAEVSIKPAGASMALMGRFKSADGCLTFDPTLPFVPGQSYRVEWMDTAGHPQSKDFKFTGAPLPQPSVRLAPQAILPANALKIYLHFSEPMEQGVFLERLRLLEANGKEIIGPFRETELWSPDGKRLTVWFHPGRQKTGVNLNEEEGPVLRENTKHTLVVAGSWRSTSGVTLGEDLRFDFQVGLADHEMPVMAKWQIMAPKSGTREPLAVRFDEPLDPAMTTSALSVYRGAESVPVEIEVDGLNWRAIPAQSWTTGSYELRADPNLEDLAGNNLTKPFEVDVSELPDTKTISTKRAFEVR